MHVKSKQLQYSKMLFPYISIFLSRETNSYRISSVLFIILNLSSNLNLNLQRSLPIDCLAPSFERKIHEGNRNFNLKIKISKCRKFHNLV